MDLWQVAQHPDDLDRAVVFYRNVLGAELLARYDPPGLAFFRFGTVRLLLEAGAPSALIYLAVPDAREATSRLAAADVQIVREREVIFTDADGTFGPAGWQEWMAFIRDSEGNLLGLASRHPPLS